ncbi:hypothetical protein JCM16138_14260 [Thermococcus atlanticus]
MRFFISPTRPINPTQARLKKTPSKLPTMKKEHYRMLLVLVLILAVLYTLGLVGVLPFALSYYITIFMIFLFLFLRWQRRLE